MAAHYKAGIRSYINDRIVEKGQEIDFDKRPGASMEPLNDEAWAMVKAQASERKKAGLPPLKYLWDTKDWPKDDPEDTAPGWRKPKIDAVA